MTVENTNRNTFLISLILIGIASRFLPHPPNFTAVAAVSLFAGSQMSNKKLAILIPLVILFITDLIIGFHSSMLAVYFSMTLVVGIGMWVQKGYTLPRLVSGALGASLLFFIITNAAVWAGSMIYPNNLSGLIASYVAAIPFFWNSLAGDLFFTATIFGIHYFAVNRFPLLAK